MSKLFVTAKCSDLCFVEFEGFEHDGYVPNIPGINDGDEDYVTLEIDNETGKLTGWVPLTKASYLKAVDMEEWIDKEVPAFEPDFEKALNQSKKSA